ncbi:hypothetical protein [Dyadobacter sp. 3J3]|uniref:hypothetical protein n=1 Tax=Dyadobacter sp. 3J3 TaxID=2606600 RepID=UPI00135CCA63|nr:hypothetical protein [Dyadobacter sp. 3J3]
MKNIFYILIILVLGSSRLAFAQFEGQKFISGSASVSFNNRNPNEAKSTNSYGYDFDISLGKFKTNTVASGWRLNTSLAGSKAIYRTYPDGSAIEHDKSGIKGFGAGIGKFWQFYKHFNDKIGVYAGPNIDLSYNNSDTYSVSSGPSELIKTKANAVNLSAGISAGFYYKFSEKWWVTANIAASSPINVSYSMTKQTSEDSDYYVKQKTLNYGFSPSFTFPSVGFGLRYFYGR